MLGIPKDVPQAFHLLAKPTGAICNLDCQYCYFLSKELLYPGSRFRMPDALLETYIRQLIESHRTPEVSISWQGGEPTLMGLAFFKRSVAYAEKYLRVGQRIRHTIQTNGTKLTDEWGAFLREHDFLVGLSVDGPRTLHDVYRVTKGGGGSFAQVMRGWEVLKKHDVDVNILCTVHAANADHPLEVYRFFREELESKFIQFIPIVERANLNTPMSEGNHRRHEPGDLVTGRSVGSGQYGAFLIDIFEEWVRRDVGRVYVQIFDVTLGNWLGQQTLCIFSPTCGNALALEHNGDLFACDHFVEPDYLLGNIAETHLIKLIASEEQRQFGQDKLANLPAYCRECEVRFVCHGGCPRNRFINAPPSASAPAGEAGLNYLCAGYREFFGHVERPMRIMSGLLRQGRPAAEIMSWYTAEDATLGNPVAGAGRNDPCPCGSGKKFKRCHGRPTARGMG